jgi:signal transduction histidine kinase/HPt (histidine-containing phosphotransfer) domain-containing protein
MANMRMPLLLSLPVLLGSLGLAAVGAYDNLLGSLCAALGLALYVLTLSTELTGSRHALGRAACKPMPGAVPSRAPDEDEDLANRLQAAMRRERADDAHIRNLESQLDAARLEAEHAKAAKRAFLANVSHEIRTPMNAIIGMTRLSMQTAMSPQQRDYLERTDQAAHKLLGQINNILDYAKLETDDLSIDESAFLLDDVLDSVISHSALAVGEKSVTVGLERDANLPQNLVGDAQRLTQVLVNLVDNAVKFTEQGEVTVAARLLGLNAKRAVVSFEVRDTGVGIERGDQRTLFDAFEQGDPSLTRRFGGSGLGLSISHRLVIAMGGRLRVDSQLGRGSCFSFALTLPLEERQRANSPTTSASEAAHEPGAVLPLQMDLSNTHLRLNGDEQLLRRLLTRFRADYVGFVEDYASLHGAGDRFGASKLARALESATGSLGAIELKEAAARLAMKRRNDDDPTDDLSLVRRLLDGLLIEIDARLGNRGTPAESTETRQSDTELDGAELTFALEQLAELLAEFDAAAINCFEELSASLPRLVARDTIDDLQRAINGFDFARALEQLRQIADKLGIALPVAG